MSIGNLIEIIEDQAENAVSRIVTAETLEALGMKFNSDSRKLLDILAMRLYIEGFQAGANHLATALTRE